MAISLENLTIGETYDRVFLASLWGYKGWEGIGRGIVTPAKDNKIVLFVTKIKQKKDVQYNDYFIEEGLLHIEGEKNHVNDFRIVKSGDSNDKIYLFYREIHHTKFVYYGEVYLTNYKIYSDKPSSFIFSTSKSLAISYNNLGIELNKSGQTNITPDKEGIK